MLLYASGTVASNGLICIEVWTKLVLSWTKLMDAVVIAMMPGDERVYN